MGNASCATFSICRVEGEAWVGEFYGASQLFWLWVVNILPRGEYLAHCVCRNSFAAVFALEAPDLIMCRDHSTAGKGRYRGLKLPLIWETWCRSLIWCKCPCKPLKESWCEYSLSQDTPGTDVCVCCSFLSPSRLFFPWFTSKWTGIPRTGSSLPALLWDYVNLTVFLQYAGIWKNCRITESSLYLKHFLEKSVSFFGL